MDRLTLHSPAGAWPAKCAIGTITLDAHDRHRRRMRLETDDGRAVLLDLAVATMLRDGDGLGSASGDWYAVTAASEPVLIVTADSPHTLLRMAWHLGNRHVPAEIRPECLLIRDDHVLADMLTRLGARVERDIRPFQPESGAYAHGADRHHHSHHHGADAKARVKA